MTAVLADNVFDGSRWIGRAVVRWVGSLIEEVEPVRANTSRDSDYEADVVLPGLIDAAVRAVGYVERPGGMPFAPEDAFALLSLRYGVTTVVDVGNSSEVLAHLRRSAAKGVGPRIVAAGPRLVSEATLRTDRVVDEGDVRQTLAGLAANGTAFVSIGLIEPSLRKQIGQLAAAARLTVVASAGTGDVPGLDVVAPSGGVAGIPQLEAVSRWSVEGLLDAHDAAEAAAFLPYARHFQQRGGRVGRRMARGVLNGLYGDREAIDADERARRAAVEIAEHRCLASSGSGAAGLVPGASLWSEIETFERLSTTTHALAAATGSPSDWITGITGGRIAAGRPADLLFAGGIDSDAATSDIRQHLSAVVIDGHHIEVRQLVESSDGLRRKALQEVL